MIFVIDNTLIEHFCIEHYQTKCRQHYGGV